VLGDATLTYEEMATLLAQVGTCFNSRPLQALFDDVSAFMPGHFLIGSSLIAVPEPAMKALVSGLSRWRHIQKMRDHFWNCWSGKYLQTLAHRPNGTRHRDFSIGRLCLIRNKLTPPTKWPLARIIAVHPGKDGLVRVVTMHIVQCFYTEREKMIRLYSNIDFNF